MKYKDRNYMCPACLKEYVIGTNHCGEIYSGCKKCSSRVLICIEPDAVRYNLTTNVGIHTYRFDMSKEYDRIKYTELENKLNKLGYTKFNVASEVPIKATLVKLLNEREIDTIQIYDEHIFENQYISSVGRVHKWCETIYPNIDIKEGYYLIFKEDSVGYIRVCKRCGEEVQIEKEIEEYPYECLNCDENMYEFETEVIKKRVM